MISKGFGNAYGIKSRDMQNSSDDFCEPISMMVDCIVKPWRLNAMKAHDDGHPVVACQASITSNDS